jgi:hypothetical protein
MNQAQAQAEAQRRWGLGAYVFDRESSKFHHSYIKAFGRFYVGCPSSDQNFPYGNGNTWEEAFADVAKH